MKALLEINWLALLKGFGWYWADFLKYRKMGVNQNSVARILDLRPYLADKRAKTEIEPIFLSAGMNTPNCLSLKEVLKKIFLKRS